MEKSSLALSAISRSPSLYEAVSEQLLAAIREADLQPGAKIPSERELGERFGVSRTVIREAIRHLAAKGVLVVITGSGVQVADVGHEGVSESLDLYLRQRGSLTPQALYEVRDTIETRTSALAAERATEVQVAALFALCDQMSDALSDAERASRADVEFHRGIAEATGNDLFLVLVDSIGDVMYQMRRATLGDAARGRVAVDAHRRIAEAIASRDPEAARRAMADHLEDSIIAYGRATGV